MTAVVVGAGLSGLVAAHALAARGEDVLLLEESPRPGGVVRTEERDGWLLELGPNTVRPTPELWSLVESLGLEPEAMLADPRLPRFVDFGGRLHALPGSLSGMVSSRLLSTRGKLRLLAEPLVPRGDASRETVREFVTRRLGPEVAERLVEPFVSGIWAGRSDRLSLAEAFPLLARWESQSGSLTRGALAGLLRMPKAKRSERRGLVSFRHGLETLPRRLAESLGGRARFGARVESVRRDAGVWRLEVAGSDVVADRLCIATAAPEAARLVAGVDADSAAALSAIPHPPLVVLHLSTPAAGGLRGFGHLVVPQPARRILGAIWSSSIFPGRAPAGRSLLTVFLGGVRDPDAIDLDDDALRDVAARDLAAALGIPADFGAVRVTRYPRAIPQYDAGHRSRLETLARAEARLPGLSFLGSYRGGVSVGDVVRQALAI
ncbi:MAG: protoporphyrinogen oxidase [Acidobacteriota bacterium]